MTTQSSQELAKEGCIVALQRCHAVLEHVSDEDFVAQVPDYGSIGSHVRHTIEHFTCLLNGLESGTADYDARERNHGLETSLQQTRDTLQSLIDTLNNQEVSDAGTIKIRQLARPDSEPVELDTNIARELLFLSGHTIHHLAIILLISSQLGLDVPKELGVAFSTQAYRTPASTS